MSFFDEDDDPPRTTSRTRVRSTPPPRRGRVATAGGPSDPQTVLVRRMVAGLVGVVILLLLFFLVRACNNTRQENALRDYNRQVSGLATASEQTGDQFFKQMDAAAQTVAGRALSVDPRLQGRGRQHAQAGAGAQRPGRHGLRAAVAADPARAAPRRPGLDRRADPHRARRRGRRGGRGDRGHRRRHARVRRLRCPVRPARDPVHQGGASRTRGSAVRRSPRRSS